MSDLASSLIKVLAITAIVSVIAIEAWLIYGLSTRFLNQGPKPTTPFLSQMAQRLLAWYFAVIFIAVAIASRGVIIVGFSVWLLPLIGVLIIRALGTPRTDASHPTLMRMIGYCTGIVGVVWIFICFFSFSKRHVSLLDAAIIGEIIFAFVAAIVSGVLAGTTVFYWRQLI